MLNENVSQPQDFAKMWVSKIRAEETNAFQGKGVTAERYGMAVAVLTVETSFHGQAIAAEFLRLYSVSVVEGSRTEIRMGGRKIVAEDCLKIHTTRCALENTLLHMDRVLPSSSVFLGNQGTVPSLSDSEKTSPIPASA
ncbi:unnamed protein product [Lepidochelys kempii]